MADKPDLAPQIAAFLAEDALTAPVSELAKAQPGSGDDRWRKMFAAFPDATQDELRRGALIAIELMIGRSDEIAATTEELRKQLDD